VRARAIENTCYVAACSPAPPLEDDAYPAWGHSMVVDPFGAVLSCAEREERVIFAEVDGERLAEVRRGVPVLAQRRPLAYG
jgi:predicted amidohydrolase